MKTSLFKNLTNVDVTAKGIIKTINLTKIQSNIRKNKNSNLDNETK